MCLKWDPQEQYIRTFVHHEPLGDRRRDRTRKVFSDEVRAARTTTAANRIRDSAYLQALAIANAKIVAHLHGHANNIKWPVVWTHGDCYILHPPESGAVSDTLVGNFPCTPRYCPNHGIRGAIQLLHSTWDDYWHMGDIPSSASIEEALQDSSLIDGIPLPAFDVDYHHAEDNVHNSVNDDVTLDTSGNAVVDKTLQHKTGKTGPSQLTHQLAHNGSDGDDGSGNAVVDNTLHHKTGNTGPSVFKPIAPHTNHSDGDANGDTTWDHPCADER